MSKARDPRPDGPAKAPAARRPARGARDPLDAIIGFQLRRAQLQTSNELIGLLRRVDLRPAQFALLKVLHSNPGVNQTVAARMLAIKRTNFVALMDDLERRGLAERQVSTRDRRGRPLHLTEAGAALLGQAASIHAAHERDLTRRLGGDPGRRALLDLLRLLTDGGEAES